ncbi:T-cell surface glycoprotein CD1e, membrane-associated [Tupaia chinensis]|uniref:T-cell surface glycoprotein CD1e, membrane-associated n=1 Tax=Tupaia chinensis TaxID=246437 RepID=L9JFP0_TUPCH|nr:T-cell surface glycoprotein CD1e, membrane-associated [Tupaia chinensis]
MLLQLLLLLVVLPGGDSVDAFQDPTSYSVIQIASFVNSTWAQIQGSGWLGDLQIHGWDRDADTAIFLKPWSKGNFSDEKMAEMVEIFRVYLFGFIQEIQKRTSELQLKYPFEIQGRAGCELRTGGTTESFLRGALGGLDFLSLKNDTCVPSPEGGEIAQRVCTLLMQYQGIIEIVQNLLFEICPQYLLGVLEAGKADLQKQVKPQVWLSSGPSPGYLFGFIQEIQKRTSELQLKYPFEIQGRAGCELRTGGTTESFLRGALGGLDFLSLKNDTCVPSPEGGEIAQRVCTLLMQYQGIIEIVQNLLFEICPQYLLGVLEAGKADLQKQVKPQVWLSSGPSPGPGRLLLVCHVSGFYPKPRWVMWMRGEQEQPGTQQGDVLPNADWTWYLRVTLDVAAGEEAGLSCRVKHSSLGGQDIILYWGHPISTGMIFLAIIVTCLVILLFLALWFMKRRISHLHWLDLFGNNGDLLGYFVIPGIMVYEALDFATRGKAQSGPGSRGKDSHGEGKEGGEGALAFQGPTSYHIIKMASFVNSSWAQIQGSGWLGDLQIHGWDRDADTVTLLKPWSKGNFSGEEFTEFVKLVRFYFVRFFQEIQKRTSGSEKYPFEVQGIAGCELRPGGATESFLRTAVGGLEFLSFQNDTCTPSPEGGRLAQEVCTLINLFPNTFKIVRKLLYETCPRYLLGVLDAGKVDLQRQVKPQAWLSSGARPGPGRLLLVCHVSGFYPKPRWVMWMRGEQEQPGTQQGDVLPNADWTWYVRVTLDIAAGEEAGLSCRVKHSSLGGQDINLHWAPQAPGLHHLNTEDPPCFRMLQISSFANRSWTQTQGSGWLGELQTHGWDSVLGTIRFLWPWSPGNFSKEELKNLQALFQLYFHGFTLEVQAFASQFHFEYPFELQVSFGCRMHAGKTTESFLMGAYQGLDFLSFDGSTWVPSPGAGSSAQNVCKVLNRYRDIKEIVQSLLSDTCPRLLAGLLKAGKSELERQVKPQVWLSSGPSPGPGRLLLVCHVSGFHPKPVWAMWMRGEQEQPGTQRGDTLPNADGTWYLRVTVDVAAGEAAGLSCRVKHSSLGGHDIIIHWGGHSILLILICLTVMVTLVMLIAVDSGFKYQSSNGNILCLHVPDPAFPTGTNTQGPKKSGPLCLAQESGIENRFLKKWKMRLHQLW